MKPETIPAQEVFNRIAPGWYNFRHRTIFRVELDTMAQRWQSGHLLNIGCAHGSDFLPFIRNFDLTGVDFSSQMLRLAQNYSHKFDFFANLVLADAGHLPFSDGIFDRAIAVATYHHISGTEARLAAFKELRRVLKPGGEAFITVWNRWQPRFWKRRKDTTVAWKTGECTLERYYHLFTYRELVNLARCAAFTVLRVNPESSYRFPLSIFSRNICLLVRK